MRRAGRPVRQCKPVALAHHDQFFGEGAECLRTTRRGEKKRKKREVKGKQEATRAKIFSSSTSLIFFLDLLLQPPQPPQPRKLQGSNESQTWPRPQKPPWPKSRGRRRRRPRSRPLLLRAAAAASRPRSPSPSSRRWRASTPMVIEKETAFSFRNWPRLRFLFFCFLWEHRVDVSHFAQGRREQSKVRRPPPALEEKLKESVALQHRDCKTKSNSRLFSRLLPHIPDTAAAEERYAKIRAAFVDAFKGEPEVFARAPGEFLFFLFSLMDTLARSSPNRLFAKASQ